MRCGLALAVASLAACQLTETHAWGEPPPPVHRVPVVESPSGCDLTALDDLVQRLEVATARERGRLVAAELPSICRLPAYLEQDLDERRLDPDGRPEPTAARREQVEHALARLCPEHDLVEHWSNGMPYRAAELYDGCDLARFGTFAPASFVDAPPSAMPILTQQWLLDQGVRPLFARAIARAYVIQDLRSNARVWLPNDLAPPLVPDRPHDEWWRFENLHPNHVDPETHRVYVRRDGIWWDDRRVETFRRSSTDRRAIEVGSLSELRLRALPPEDWDDDVAYPENRAYLFVDGDLPWGVVRPVYSALVSAGGLDQLRHVVDTPSGRLFQLSLHQERDVQRWRLPSSRGSQPRKWLRVHVDAEGFLVTEGTPTRSGKPPHRKRLSNLDAVKLFALRFDDHLRLAVSADDDITYAALMALLDGLERDCRARDHCSSDLALVDDSTDAEPRLPVKAW